jgi:CDP-diacylglycerol--glycerol-3-phosphate 3-phosphatidyltransferase
MSDLTLTDWLRKKTAFITEPVAARLARWGVHPNTVTLVGGLLSFLVAAILARGHLALGGIVLLTASAVDAFDGALARHAGLRSDFGAFLDSTVDRISDGAFFLGLLAYLLSVPRPVDVFLAVAALLGSLLVSYSRARAEGTGFSCNVGWLTRVPRIGVLGIGLIAQQVRGTLLVLVVFSWVTVLQRVLHVYREAQARDDNPDPQPG